MVVGIEVSVMVVGSGCGSGYCGVMVVGSGCGSGY